MPPATVTRLPGYYRALLGLADEGVETISSEDLARAAGVTGAKLRKDLSQLGSFGTRGVGYDVESLTSRIGAVLGLTKDWAVLIVGAGNLGRALATYAGLGAQGFRIVAALDIDPARVGTTVRQSRLGEDDCDVVVGHLDDLEAEVARSSPDIAVIATPATAAQDVCDRLVAAGVRSVLNFAPVVLEVPADTVVRNVDLATELHILAFHERRRESRGA